MGHRLRHRTQQRTADSALAARAQNRHVAGQAFNHVDQRMRRVAHAHRHFVRHAGGVEQRTCWRHQKFAGGLAGLGNQLRVARHHQLVQRRGLLHIGQHHAGAQTVLCQLHRVVDGIQRQVRAIDGDQNFQHGNSFF